ncbi:uncharacterized protein Tco025E_02698 [Trypanosoma conorhini]|uniref:Uncharacterized protein n=1 Tax=Trypanosoma conorhini TaxID=83891 RepID=A0A422Q1V8_9TRYP|nr:uncharacterized protein Tco025E_02698 [Trypanosoma conorhini]RNF23940.1 hypothetical protein Tco025E_02698 [Trypanosoma conorhini]
MTSVVVYTRAPRSTSPHPCTAPNDDNRETSGSSTLPPPSTGAAAPRGSGFGQNGDRGGGAKVEEGRAVRLAAASRSAPAAGAWSRGSSKNRSEESVNRPPARLDASYEEIYTEEDQYARPVSNGGSRRRWNSYDEDVFYDEEYISEEDEEDEEDEDEDVPRIAIIGGPNNKRFVRDILYGTARASEPSLAPPNGRHREEQHSRDSADAWSRNFSFPDAEHDALGSRRADGSERRGGSLLKKTVRTRQEGHPRHVQPNSPSSSEELPDGPAKVLRLSPLRQRSPLAHETAQARAVVAARNSHAAEPFATRTDWTPARGEFDSDEAGGGALVPPQQPPCRSEPAAARSGGDAEVASVLFPEEKPQQDEEARAPLALKKKLRRRREEAEGRAAEDDGKLRRSPSPSSGSEAKAKKKKRRLRRARSGSSGHNHNNDDDDKPRGISKRKVKKEHGSGEKAAPVEGETDAAQPATQAVPVFTAEQVVPAKPNKPKVYCNTLFSRRRQSKQQKEREAARAAAKQAAAVAVKPTTEAKKGDDEAKPPAIEKRQHATQTPTPPPRRHRHHKRRLSSSSDTSDEASAPRGRTAAAAAVPRSRSLEHHRRGEKSKSPVRRGRAEKRVDNWNDVD